MDEMFELSNTCQVATYIIHDQSYYIEVAKGDIFMEQKMRFGMVLGLWQYWKNYWGPIMLYVFGLNQRLRLILKTTALNFILKYSNSNKRYWIMKELQLKRKMWTHQETWTCQQFWICFHLKKFQFCFANTSSYPRLFHIPQLPSKLELAYQ